MKIASFSGNGMTQFGRASNSTSNIEILCANTSQAKDAPNECLQPSEPAPLGVALSDQRTEPETRI
jgi:hypothetical protein